MNRFWEPIIEPLLEALEPVVIVEIGSDEGLNTRNLITFARAAGATLHVIDPLPKYEPDDWVRESRGRLVFHRVPSLEAISTIERPDMVLIDGDHNWHTVINELRAIEDKAAEGGNPLPVILLHDVSWPYGRRDLYYEPDRIPPTERQPYARGGIRPGQSDVDTAGGFNNHLANARHEGGPRNGVLTAVEDFMVSSDLELTLVVVPAFNGLGVLYRSDLGIDQPDAVGFIESLRDATGYRILLDREESERMAHMISAQDLLTERDSLAASLDDERRRADMLSGELQLHREFAERSAARMDVERRRADQAVADLELAQAAVRDLRRKLSESKQGAKSAEARYRRLRGRRSVRAALKLAGLLSPFIRREGRIGNADSLAGTAPGRVSRSSLRNQSRLVANIQARRPGSAVTSGSLVSIIVLTRDGAEHLRRLLNALDARTYYRSFELIVVDNGSTDDTAAVLAIPRHYPIRVIRNEYNASFSRGNNQAADIAEGRFLLFLNNDIEPINGGWLGSMVEAIEGGESVVAVGAELVYPVRGIAATDLTVQHIGIRFSHMEGAVRPVNLSAKDPLDPRFESIVDSPAITGAAMLVDRDAFLQIGGFDEAYIYGTEDVDLSLKLTELGRVVVTGQAVLFHHESATQRETAEEAKRVNRLRNRLHFADRWGSRLTRSVRRDQLTGSGEWTTAIPRTVAITLTRNDEKAGWGDYYTAHELGDAFEAIGWEVVYLERYRDHWYDPPAGDVNLLISLLDSYDVRRGPDGAFTVAWVRNWVDRWTDQEWFESYNLVVTSSHKASSLIATKSTFAPTVIPMATNPTRFQPGPPDPGFESDYVFTGNNWGPGRGVIAALEVEPGEQFLLFGKDWDADPRTARHWRGTVTYQELPKVYRSTKIVLDDTASPTKPYAFLNGRVFDALASGALVLTDNVEGSREMFDGLLPSFSDRRELRLQLDRFLTDEAERSSRVAALRQRVLERHSYASRPREFIGLALEEIERPHVGIKIAVPSRAVQASWGDTHFAAGLAAALTELGMPTAVHILPEWDLPRNQAVDVVIHLRGLSAYEPKPAHLNIMWLISHPDDVSPRECEKYDLILVASEEHAAWLKEQVGKPVVFMPQATDSRRFHRVEPRPDLASELLFVGNSRGQRRPAVEWAIEAGLPLSIYGSGWTGKIPSQYLRAESFPNDDLAALYASAKVVLNDHWPDMRERGFVSNRVFDVLASGAALLSDDASGLRPLFGDLVPTFSGPGDLQSKAIELLHDDAARQALGATASARVVREHSFAVRALELSALIRPRLQGRVQDMSGHTFATDRNSASQAETVITS